MHISELSAFVDRDPEFSMKFVTENGEIICVEKCQCTSFHSAGRTINIKVLPSCQIRKVVRLSIIEINNKEFYI